MRAIILALSLLPAAVQADCRSDIAALFQGGPLDAFTLPPYGYETTVTTASGDVKYVLEVRWDTPLKSLSGIKGGGNYALSIGGEAWTGPGPDGPWTKSGSMGIDDIAAFQRGIAEQMARNVTDPQCLGTVDVDGMQYTAYQYVTQTDPNPDMGGSYFGGTYTVYIDPATNRQMRQDLNGAFAHYQPEPSTDISVSLYRYGPEFAISPPE